MDIFIATHGNMSDGLKDAANVIVGMTNNIKTFNLLTDTPVEELGSQINTALAEVGEEGAVILTDLVSASPWNQSRLAINELASDNKENIYVIGGVNLPMLLEAINHQLINTPVAEVAEALKKQGKNSIDSWNIKELSQVDTDDDDDF